jgi:hypothetical protein
VETRPCQGLRTMRLCLRYSMILGNSSVDIGCTCGAGCASQASSLRLSWHLTGHLTERVRRADTPPATTHDLYIRANNMLAVLLSNA